MKASSPIVPEIEAPENDEVYQSWLRVKVSSSLADDIPTLSHNEAMRVAHNVIDSRRSAKA